MAVQVRRFVYLAGAIAASLIAGGCNLFGSSVQVRVTLPELPDIWREPWGPAGYELEWISLFSASGTCRTAPDERHVVLELPRTPVVAVLAYPVWESGGPSLVSRERLRPAGGVWAAEDPGLLGRRRGPPNLDLSFNDGPLAFVLASAAARGADIQSFNFRRFAAELAERLPGDPWTLDCGRIVRALCERAMRVSYIREVSRHEIALDIPEGTWLSASPFASVLTGGVKLVRMVEGVTPFYGADGGRLVVDVDSEGRSWCGLSPP